MLPLHNAKLYDVCIVHVKNTTSPWVPKSTCGVVGVAIGKYNIALAVYKYVVCIYALMWLFYLDFVCLMLVSVTMGSSNKAV